MLRMTRMTVPQQSDRITSRLEIQELNEENLQEVWNRLH